MALPGVAPRPTRDLFQGLGKGKDEGTTFAHAKAGTLVADAVAGSVALAAVGAMAGAMPGTGPFLFFVGCEIGATNNISNVTIVTAIAPVVVANSNIEICLAIPTTFA